MRCLAAGGLLLALLPAAAAEQLWMYVDGRGVAHFAAREVDSRYQRLLGSGPAVPRVDGKSGSTDKLLVWLEIAPEVKATQRWVKEAARAQGLDAELLLALIAVESRFDAAAVSPRGAIGLMQIMAASGDRYATDAERARPAPERLRDARTNIHTGARMLSDLLRRHGRVDHALAAWNAGEVPVRRHGGLPPIDETRAHVHQVLELYWALLQRSLGARARALTLP